MKRLAQVSALLVFLNAPLPAQDSAARTTAELEKLNGALEFLRGRNAGDYAIRTPNGIDESRYVTIGGIEQWISIRGENRANPVILLLHGGPGDATNPWGYAGFRTWLRHFTVVQWDQRGAGRTLGRSGPGIAPTITIERMTQDGIELATLLRRDLAVDKLIVVGHSWGSILGVHMVKARPELFHAFVGTGQVGDPGRNYAVAYAELLRAAGRRGEQTAVRELNEIGPPPWRDRRPYGVQRKWANLFEGADAFLASTFGLGLMAPGYSTKDVNDWFDGQNLSGQRLVPVTSVLSPAALAGEFSVPVFVIQGTDDFTTPASLARTFVDSVRAPHKEFIPIEGGHFAVFMKQEMFLDALLTRVLPQVKRP
jgi:pimeloyl-ACP methyl ester carboxylesterase